MAEPLSAAALATRQKQRNGLLMNAKKKITKATGVLAASPRVEADVLLSLGKLRDYFKRIADMNDAIQCSLAGDEQDKDIQQMMVTDDVMLDMIVQLETAGKLLEKPVQIPHATGNVSLHDNSTSSVGEHSRVRLPKIDLWEYDGDPLKWDEFWDYYEVTFHKNDSIPVIEKFTYLKKILVDDARRVINGYHLTSANYDQVIEALKERFGDPEVAIFQHFDAMLSMSAASGEVGELQRVFDNCEAHIRSLIALGLSEETFGRVFAPILLSKLPGTVRVELIRKKGRGKWTLTKLREFLRDEIYARDMSKKSFGSPSNGQHGNQRSHGSSSNGKKMHQNTASVLQNAGQSGSKQSGTGRKSPSCQFCKGNHYGDKCSKYTTAESRRRQVRGQCYTCLKKGHSSKDCNSEKPCFFCQKTTHHQSLCNKKFPSEKSGTNDSSSTQLSVGSNNSDTKSVTSNIMSHDGQRGVLQTAVSPVSGMKNEVSARHMLDNGSDNSFISCKLAQQIGAKCIGEDTISLAGFADAKRREKTYKIYEFDVHLRSGKRLSLKAYGTDVIVCSIDKLAFDTKKYPLLTRISLAEPLAQRDEHVSVDILVGSDYYYDIVKTERIPLEDGLMLLDSELGYVVAGRTASGSKNIASLIVSRETNPQSNFNIEKFWKLEEIGVKDVADTHEHEVALSNFNSTVQFDETDRRYMVKWPFKPDCPALPENFGLAFGRLKSLVSRATAENDLLQKCQVIFDDQLAKGIIEKAPSIPDGSLVHYLPHHAVITPQKATTKVRIVYDASSKASKHMASLNDCLYRGPVLLEDLSHAWASPTPAYTGCRFITPLRSGFQSITYDLSGLLLRFRLNPVGVVSDIEKAFLQVGLQQEDRDITRFLWLKDLTKPCAMDNLVIFRFTRVCFGAKASPFLLGGTVNYHLNKVDTPVAEKIRLNLYVDNVIDSKQSTEEAIEYYGEAKDIFRGASMNLREWFSNDAEFMKTVAEEDRGTGSYTKVLGLQWDVTMDTLCCPTDGLKNSSKTTKRLVLQTVAKVYDPCGYFTPITSPAKWLMQELWQKKYDWDTPLSEDLVQCWDTIFCNLKKISQCAIPRRYFDVIFDDSPVDIHVFCDASAKAYCAAVYVVVNTSSGRMSSLVFSKCRVSPVKHQSIPRLELLAATVGIRLLEFVAKELRLPIGEKFLWSDSQCVLHWITGKPVSTVFVRNRVQEIKKVQNVNFRFVPTAENPADIPTRGSDVDKLQSSTLWWQGPSWLPQASQWPNNPILPIESSDTAAVALQSGQSNSTENVDEQNHQYLFDVNRMSSLLKLVRVTAWVLRFVENVRCAVAKKGKMKLRERNDGSGRISNPLVLSANELRLAKVVWERAVQHQHFGYLLRSKGNVKTSIKSLGSIVVDNDGVMRCQGRLGNSGLSEITIEPKLLPKKNPFTRLVIADCHETYNHAGVGQTLAEIRCEYWVVNGRAEVKCVIRRCLLCRRQKGGSFRAPPIPDLPDFRVTKSPPFHSVGVDYLGPLLIFPPDSPSAHKVWICLFTCAVTRAVHLEVVSQMDSTQFLLCFRRFMSFCGCPRLVVSDNAGQFDLSRRKLDKLWHQSCKNDDVQNFSASRQIEWKFIPEKSPWMGGFYERLVGVVKSSLRAAIDRRKLSLVELQTVVYEVANVVNGRPLTYLEDDVADAPLTPAHLLMRHRTIKPFVTDDVTSEEDSSRDKIVAGWKRLQSLINVFWSHWQKHYLLSLREHSRKNKQRNAVDSKPRVGEVVLVEDKTLPRSQWRVGRVVELVASGDGRIRSVKLGLPNGRLLNRPTRQLYPLELQ